MINYPLFPPKSFCGVSPTPFHFIVPSAFLCDLCLELKWINEHKQLWVKPSLSSLTEPLFGDRNCPLLYLLRYSISIHIVG